LTAINPRTLVASVHISPRKEGYCLSGRVGGPRRALRAPALRA
jgi:hypothetical protein